MVEYRMSRGWLQLLTQAQFVDGVEFFIRECGVGQGSDIVENLLWF
jgi:hypothetical protein